MLVAEDRTYYFDRRVVYSAVFNDHPIEPALKLARDGQMERAVEALRATGVTHVVVNWAELRRLATTYSYSYEGRKRQGYLPEVDLQTREPLLSLLNAAGQEVARAGSTNWPGEDSRERVPVYQVYDVRPRPVPQGSGGMGKSGPTSPASTR
jgi:hypothetical protein